MGLETAPALVVSAGGERRAEALASRQLEILWAGVAVLCAAALLLLPRVAPGVVPGLAASLPGCPIKTLTGLPCPTCGATRATLALSDLDPLAALAWNPLVAVAWGILLLGGLGALGRAWAHCPLPSLPRRLGRWQRLGLLAAIGANWLYLLYRGV